MPDMLACRYTNRAGNTQIQPLRNINGTFVAFGNPFTPTALAADGLNVSYKLNYVLGWRGRFFCSAGRDLRKYNPATQNWDVQVAGYSVAASADGSLFLMRGPTGALQVVVVFGLAGNTMAARTLDDPVSGSWSAAVNSGIFTSGTWPLYPVKYNNVLYFVTSSAVSNFDPAGSSFIQQVGFNPTPNGCLVRCGTRLFLVAVSNTVHAYASVYERVGGSFVLVVDGATLAVMPRVNGASAPAASSLIGFHDKASASLIVMGWQDAATAGAGNPGGSGWITVRVPLTTLTPTALTGTVVPSGLGVPGGPSSVNDVRWAIEVDTVTNPLAPVTYVWVCPNNGLWSRFRWNGIGSPMTPLGVGGNRGIALSHNPNGGGEYYYSGSTTVNPVYRVDEAQARVPIAGGIRLFFQVDLFDETGGVPTPTDETVSVYFGKEQQTADTLATLTNPQKVSGPGTVPLLSLGKIANVTCGDGSVYSVDWLSDGDGIPDQTQHMLEMRVEL